MSAEQDKTCILHTSEYCLHDVINFGLESQDLHINSEAGPLLNLAAVIYEAMRETDKSKGIVVQATSFTDLGSKHLVKEYVGNPNSNEPEKIVIRHFLIDCPHREVNVQTMPPPAAAFQ